jgi:ABC-2 type transport system ATP-binding protein
VAAAAALLEAVPGVRGTATDSVGWLSVEMGDSEGPEGQPDRNRLLDALIRAEIPVLGFEVAGGRLQDVFLQLTAEAIE